MKCPLCKYEPKLKKNGTAKKGYISFAEILVFGDTKVDYTYNKTWISYSCPRCGIMFRYIKEIK